MFKFIKLKKNIKNSFLAAYLVLAAAPATAMADSKSELIETREKFKNRLVPSYGQSVVLGGVVFKQLKGYWGINNPSPSTTLVRGARPFIVRRPVSYFFIENTLQNFSFNPTAKTPLLPALISEDGYDLYALSGQVSVVYSSAANVNVAQLQNKYSLKVVQRFPNSNTIIFYPTKSVDLFNLLGELRKLEYLTSVELELVPTAVETL